MTEYIMNKGTTLETEITEDTGFSFTFHALGVNPKTGHHNGAVTHKFNCDISHEKATKTKNRKAILEMQLGKHFYAILDGADINEVLADMVNVAESTLGIKINKLHLTCRQATKPAGEILNLTYIPEQETTAE